MQLKTISGLLSSIFANWRADLPSGNRNFRIQASAFDRETPAPFEGKMDGVVELTLSKNSRERTFSIDLPYRGSSGAGFSIDLISEKVDGAKGIEFFLQKYPKIANEVKKSLFQTIEHSLEEAKGSSNRSSRYHRDVLKSLGLYVSEATATLEVLKEKI